jgi:hypothetical protein
MNISGRTTLRQTRRLSPGFDRGAGFGAMMVIVVSMFAPGFWGCARDDRVTHGAAHIQHPSVVSEALMQPMSGETEARRRLDEAIRRGPDETSGERYAHPFGDWSARFDLTGVPIGLNDGEPKKGEAPDPAERCYLLSGTISTASGLIEMDVRGVLAFKMRGANEAEAADATAIDHALVTPITRFAMLVPMPIGGGDVVIRHTPYDPVLKMVHSDLPPDGIRFETPDRGTIYLYYRSAWPDAKLHSLYGVAKAYFAPVLVLPIELRPDGTLRIDTGVEIPSYRLLPVLNDPYSDQNHDGVLDERDRAAFVRELREAASDPRQDFEGDMRRRYADLNKDGAFDEGDLREFDRIHERDRTRPR